MGQAQFEKALQTQLILAEDGEVIELEAGNFQISGSCLLYTSPSPRDRQKSRMPSSA